MTVKISAVMSNSQWLDGGSMFGNVPRAVWQAWTQVDDLGRIPLACRCLLVELDDRRILCETGIGSFFPEKLAKRYGVVEKEHVLLQSLAALGLTDSDIDVVILSHLHFDHAGGLLPSYGEIAAGRQDLLFPRAKFVVGRAAWQRAQKPHPRDRASFIPDLCAKLESTGRLFIQDREAADSPAGARISFRFSDGHTIGQMHSVVAGEHGKIIFAGDLIPGVAWVHAPVTMGYDRFPEKVIDEKLSLYEQACREKWWLFYTHDPKVSMSKVQEEPGGKFRAWDEQTRVQRMVV